MGYLIVAKNFLTSSYLGMTFLSQLYPSSQNEEALRGEMNRQQAKNPHSRTGTNYMKYKTKTCYLLMMDSLMMDSELTLTKRKNFLKMRYLSIRLKKKILGSDSLA